MVGKNFLITTRYENIDPLHSFAKAFSEHVVLGHDGVATHGGHLFIAMTRNLYSALGHACDTVNRRLHDIEERVFSGDERRMVAQLSQVGRIVHDFKQTLAPHEEMLKSLEPVGMRMFGPEFSYHVNSLIGSYERIERLLANVRDSLHELRETNNSLLSTKQNEIMKTFTILAFFFLPLTFITSIFSMNVSGLPVAGTPFDFWIIVGSMTTIVAGCYFYFRHKGWL